MLDLVTHWQTIRTRWIMKRPVLERGENTKGVSTLGEQDFVVESETPEDLHNRRFEL